MVAQNNDNQVAIMEKALTRFIDQCLQGKTVDADEFAGQYPQCEGRLKKRIQDLREIDFLFDSLVQADEAEFEGKVIPHELVGQKLASFEVEKVVGSGGMGVVYLAHDTKLDRSVAIKSLPTGLLRSSTARTRLRCEAKLLASLNHPNIAVIHDIIEEEKYGYLVLEYVPGETLAERIVRKPLKLEEILSIGQQIAEAISAAHEKGVVHRDLKPGNIKITPEGRVKVLDFGLAKASGGEGKGTAAQSGRIMGTPAYMSPEQARGLPTDHRTDIWSFGCIIYEMLTGHLPFEGDTATDTLAHIIEREPNWEMLPEDTPNNIRVLLRRCLEKDPDRRLQNIGDVVIEIRKTLGTSAMPVSAKSKKVAMIIGAAILIILTAIAVRIIPQKQALPSSEEKRLVVLPFDNRGPAEAEWFADGMNREITDRLSGVHGLAVIARDSAIQCREREMGTREIAKELNVDYILAGAVRCENPTDPDSRVKIDLQLIETSSDTQVWRRPFDCNRSQLFEIQSQVAEQVAQQLDIHLRDKDRFRSRHIPTNSTEAHNLVLQGNAAGSYRDAIPLYEEAIELDPNYVWALGKLASAHMEIYWFEDRSPERLAQAEMAARKALTLMPDHHFPHMVMARYYYQGHLDYERALEHLEKVRELLPNHRWMLYWTHCVQRRMGNFQAALDNITRAFELNPFSSHFAAYLGQTHVLLREYRQAEHYYELAIMLNPNRSQGYYKKACLYLIWQGDGKKAQKVIEDGLLHNKKLTNSPGVFHVLFKAHLMEREYEQALKILKERSKDIVHNAVFIPNSLWRAEVYGYMGNKELEKQNYESAVAILEDKVAENPGDDRYHSALGSAYAGLGREQEAIEQGLLGVKCLPVDKDAVQGPMRLEDLARIYVMLGKYNEAIDIVEDLLNRDCHFTRPKLRHDPVWDPLRKEPRFQKLLSVPR